LKLHTIHFGISFINVCRRMKSIKTRIETCSSRSCQVASDCRRMKSIKTRIETPLNPPSHMIRLEVGGWNPLKQGLKPEKRLTKHGADTVGGWNPLKQGLKQKGFFAANNHTQSRRMKSIKTRIETF